MNAKETLKKIAEALNIVESAQEEKVKAEKPVETTETTESVEVKETDEKVEEVKELPEVTEEVAEVEEVKEVKAEEPSKEDERVRELESQLADLKKILEAAMVNEKEVIPEVKKEEPKGLTHSPEKEVKKKSGGIGSKGMSIQERVYKYMNN